MRLILLAILALMTLCAGWRAVPDLVTLVQWFRFKRMSPEKRKSYLAKKLGQDE